MARSRASGEPVTGRISGSAFFVSAAALAAGFAGAAATGITATAGDVVGLADTVGLADVVGLVVGDVVGLADVVGVGLGVLEDSITRRTRLPLGPASER